MVNCKRAATTPINITETLQHGMEYKCQMLEGSEAWLVDKFT